MSEQNRRTLDLQPSPGDVRPQAPVRKGSTNEELGSAIPSSEADERQTARQAPPNASPGESAEGDSIG